APGGVPKWLRERSAKPPCTGSNPVAASLQRVELRGENEVVLREPADRVRPDGDVDAVVVHPEIGVVSLGLGHGGEGVQERHGGREVGELEPAPQLLVLDTPARDLLRQAGCGGVRERGVTPTAGDAVSVTQGHSPNRANPSAAVQTAFSV